MNDLRNAPTAVIDAFIDRMIADGLDPCSVEDCYIAVQAIRQGESRG